MKTWPTFCSRVMRASTCCASCRRGRLANLLHSQGVVLDYGVLTSTRQERQLEPRYRRILSFGDVLDESIGLFRRHWATFALVSAVCLLPPGLIEVLIATNGGLDTSSLLSELASGGTPDLNSVSRIGGTLFLVGLISGLFALAWAAAIAVTTDEYLHATEPLMSSVFSQVLRRYPYVLLTALLTFAAFALVTVAATVLFVVSVVLFPILILGSLGAIIGVILWWVKPGARSVWLKWLIILATPFGLAVYFVGTWALGLIACVLELRGPIAAFRRSRDLVDHHWFRTVGILLVAAMIVSVLQYVPTMLVELPLTILALIRGQPGLSPAEQAISLAASIVTQILFASMATICYVVLFVDLRNRREGTDIAERVTQIEAAEPLPVNE
jgi:hypothetical protein